jgi:hypothetical protein
MLIIIIIIIYFVWQQKKSAKHKLLIKIYIFSRNKALKKLIAKNALINT